MKISYHTERVKMPPIFRREVSECLQCVALSYGYSVGSLNYIFCDDKKILDVNIEFLGHNYYTDIITFDYSGAGVVNGDMYISLETVRSNSTIFKTTYESELLRVIVHGLLHLCGINDKGIGERKVMEAAEERALLLLEGKKIFKKIV